MKLFYILLVFIFCQVHSLYAQGVKVNWSQLTGKWEYERVILVNVQSKTKDSTDISANYGPYFQYYESGLKFKEEFPHPQVSTTVAGNYAIDKTANKIRYSSMVQTTKYSGGKVAVPDLVFDSGKAACYVLKLTENSMVLLEPYAPDTESQGDYIYYMKRVD